MPERDLRGVRHSLIKRRDLPGQPPHGRGPSHNVTAEYQGGAGNGAQRRENADGRGLSDYIGFLSLGADPASLARRPG